MVRLKYRGTRPGTIFKVSSVYSAATAHQGAATYSGLTIGEALRCASSAVGSVSFGFAYYSRRPFAHCGLALGGAIRLRLYRLYDPKLLATSAAPAATSVVSVDRDSEATRIPSRVYSAVLSLKTHRQAHRLAPRDAARTAFARRTHKHVHTRAFAPAHTNRSPALVVPDGIGHTRWRWSYPRRRARAESSHATVVAAFEHHGTASFQCTTAHAPLPPSPLLPVSSARDGTARPCAHEVCADGRLRA